MCYFQYSKCPKPECLLTGTLWLVLDLKESRDMFCGGCTEAECGDSVGLDYKALWTRRPQDAGVFQMEKRPVGLCLTP